MTAYLATHDTALDQYRSPRRARPTGLVCIHTAESILDTIGPDTGAEAVADWMTRRTNYGSYHDLADSDSVVHLVDYGDEAFHDGTGSNPWSLSISFALPASAWPKLSAEKRRGFLRQGAIAFARQQAWLKAHGYPTTPLIRVTRAQSDAGQPGFISHAERDPSRRTDPGVFFPWGEFFDHCRAALAGHTPVPVIPEDDMPLTLTAVDTKRIYVWDGDSLWHTGDPVLAGAIGKIRNVELNQRQIDVIRADVQRRNRDRLAAVAKAASGDPVDLDALVRQLVADLADPLAGAITAKASVGGLSRDDVVEALREVLRAGVGSPAS
jgi:hypothetical protein